MAGFNPNEYDGTELFMRPVEGAQVSIAEYLDGLPEYKTKFSRNVLAIARGDAPVEHSLNLAKQIQLACDARAFEPTIRGEALAGMQMLAEAEEDIRGGNHLVSLHDQRILAALGGYSLLERDYGMIVALRMYSPGVRRDVTEMKRVISLPDCAYAPVIEVDSVVPYAAV